MQYRPNDCEITKGETRKLTFNHAAGNNVLNSFTVTCAQATFTTPVLSETTATVFATFNQSGTHKVIGTAELASGETLVGFIRAKVIDPTCDSYESDYR